MRVKKNAGIAIGNTRLDGVKAKAGSRTTSAEQARERMAARGTTDEIVQDILGGSSAADNQTKAYEKLLKGIEAGNETGKGAGSLSEAARDKMIDRDSQKGRNGEDDNDIGKDRARRRAYPGRIDK